MSATRVWRSQMQRMGDIRRMPLLTSAHGTYEVALRLGRVGFVEEKDEEEHSTPVTSLIFVILSLLAYVRTWLAGYGGSNEERSVGA